MKIQTVGTNLFLVVLELDDVVESDAGLYKVKAKNKMGEVAASINLNFSRKYYIDFFIVYLCIALLLYDLVMADDWLRPCILDSM